MDDLERQVDFIRTRRTEYNTYTTLSDVASGINFKRKGLETILDSCIQGTIGELVIAHRDRLCRFGFELIRLFVEKSGGKITVLDDERNKSSEQELSEDLLSIIHIYSCRQMGKRSYKNKQANEINKDKTETILPSEKIIE
jgi:predicted site-specific integrase-resolvase